MIMRTGKETFSTQDAATIKPCTISVVQALLKISLPGQSPRIRWTDTAPSCSPGSYSLFYTEHQSNLISLESRFSIPCACVAKSGV